VTRRRDLRRPRAVPTAAAPGRAAPCAALLLATGLLLAAAVLGACAPAGHRTAVASAAAPATPTSAAQLERLLVTSVPSGLPRMPDSQLSPPAGEKNLSDVASYAADPSRERDVLQRFGYRWGWERFWGRGTAETSVFADQFRDSAGAGAFAADLVANDAAHYRATPQPGTGGLPAGCRLLTVAQADPSVGLAGPAAFAWCSRGVFTVAVTAVAGSADAALREVSAVVRAQLDRLPAR
jgi:hypothetical protein